MNQMYRELDVESISFDHENPRIKMALEKYGELNAERISFALKSATENGSTSSYTSLRDSILASRGIMTPITVITRNNRYICVDGNTRLAIYRELAKTDRKNAANWSVIKAAVLEDCQQSDIEKIRVSAHLVGSREWPAYEKARYLHYLRSEKFMDYNEMIALCGGRKIDMERQIDAFHDMNEYYRDKVDDTEFHIDRFSGFVELQKPGIKEAIFDAGFELDDLGDWIRDGRIYRLADVRNLPKVLSNEEATEIFISGGPDSIKKAMKHIDAEEQTKVPDNKKITLESASVHQLVNTLLHRIPELTYAEISKLKNRTHSDADEQVNAFENLNEQLQRLIQDVSS